ncbi:hypothetical protein BDV37DRAFT_84501 [Aspergillus pseudonomiae]|uniref:Uncharacterized protein n=1 Tax=Aspergillus pseudonomiae TaxID=1506151 RepID=A0A5N7DI49_9EURO|nr:uncharacterized protein BDV37DRAFT_84501 [Aspergillus pseudonomiae]KAE8405915.1 hypothetical protein BDV37DRAFT_84501 [Aspergillus pseudonomiae]
MTNTLFQWVRLQRVIIEIGLHISSSDFLPLPSRLFVKKFFVSNNICFCLTLISFLFPERIVQNGH